MSPRKVRKRINIEYKFIKWSPSYKGQSLNPFISKVKAFNKRNKSLKMDLTKITFIKWSPVTKVSVSH
jgi:hypothetical protein